MVGEFDSDEHGENAQDDGKSYFQKSEVGQPAGPERMRVFGKGGERGEATQEARREEGEDPGWGNPRSVIAKEATDEEASEDVTSEDSNRESVKAGLNDQLLEGLR